MTVPLDLDAHSLAWPDTPAWHDRRSTGIGASEVAAVAGISPWDTPLGVYQRKIGEAPPIADNLPMRVGRALEETVIYECADRTGETITRYPCPLVAHPDHPFMLATPDAECESEALIEAKTASIRMSDKWGPTNTDDVPDQYLVQCQWQLHVTGRDLCYLAVLIGSDDFRVYRIERNQRLIDGLAIGVTQFWRRVEDRDPPPPDYSHPSTPGLIRGMYGTVADDEVIALGDESRQAWSEHEELGQSIKAAKARQEECKAVVSAELGTHLGGDLGDGRWLKRSVVDRKEHVVKASSYVSLRALKVRQPKETK